MTNTKKDLAGNPEFEALKDVPGINPEDIMRQVGLGDGGPASQKGHTHSDPSNPNEPGDPGSPGDPAPAPTGAPGSGATAPPAQQGDFLKEIFGDRFKTVDEVKQANIVGQLEELESLRRVKTDLEEKLKVKPHTNFVNDEVAIFNEFVRETGVNDYSVFKRIYAADIANMEPLDAIVNKHILAHPELASKEAQVRKMFERKYNIDPDMVSEEDLEINQIGMLSESGKAKKDLMDLKEKLKAPPAEEPAAPELTPEQKTALQTEWGKVGNAMSKALEKLSIPIKGAKDPLLDYSITAEEQKEIEQFVIDYAVQNRMELNTEGINVLGKMVYNQLVLNKLPDIVHSVFEKARQMTDKEVHAFYTNPSPQRNTDTPPPPAGGSGQAMTEDEKRIEDLFNAEMGMYDR